jgi:hypothetical protein
MAGKRRLHRNIGGFTVPDFADHDDVRILPQNRAQASGKGHTYFRIHLRLANAFNGIFDRIFNRQYVAGTIIQAL